MLVLSRKQKQKIIIGDNVVIEVLRVKGNTVRLGITAPDDVKILRGELEPLGSGINSIGVVDHGGGQIEIQVT